MKYQCPMRTCLGCRKKLPKDQLLKFVLDSGLVVLDKSGKADGRSGYSCKNSDCIKSFLNDKKKQFRAFRVKDCRLSRELKDRE
jgi:predicted RNA-binding protein YlxR (DUF448 family)